MTVSIARADDLWTRHTIDGSSRGADGVRLADVDGDGRLDVATGWEEGGVIRIYRHPGVEAVRRPWPSVTVGRVKSPEDAVLVDVDQDGSLDVVSCCEGDNRTVHIHRAPQGRSRYWDAATWSTTKVDATAQKQAWMFCLPELDTAVGTRPSPKRSSTALTPLPSLIVGSKGPRASVSRLTRQSDSFDNWRLARLCDAGWIMSLRNVDMDGDGDADVLLSDRRGPTRGIAWLERPADPGRDEWSKHVIGGAGEEVMFLDVGDLTGDLVDDIACATRSAGVIVCSRSQTSDNWAEQMIPMPADCGTGKGVAIGDIDLDGRADLVVSCENAGRKHGVFWLSSASGDDGHWTFHPISGVDSGIKFDRLELLDLDTDGDLDAMTCEERENLGVIWYENPTR